MAIEFRKCEACGRSNRTTRKICFSCGANLLTGIAPPEISEEPGLPPTSSSSERDAGQRPVEAVTDTDHDRKQPQGKIRAAFQWWAKHPWKVFWGIFLINFLILVIPLSSDLLDMASAICVMVLGIAWFVSFGRGLVVTWQRSKVRAVIAAVLFMIAFGLTRL